MHLRLKEELTTKIYFYGVSCIDQRLPLRLSEGSVVDQGLNLIDEGAQLVAGRTCLTDSELGNDLVELVDQAVTLILRERAIRDQCFDLSNQRCDLILG